MIWIWENDDNDDPRRWQTVYIVAQLHKTEAECVRWKLHEKSSGIISDGTTCYFIIYIHILHTNTYSCNYIMCLRYDIIRIKSSCDVLSFGFISFRFGFFFRFFLSHSLITYKKRVVAGGGVAGCRVIFILHSVCPARHSSLSVYT